MESQNVAQNKTDSTCIDVKVKCTGQGYTLLPNFCPYEMDVYI